MNNITLTAILVCCGGPAALAQSARDAKRPFEIMDNSFLVEEAFNQETGIFQNILVAQRPNAREWSFEFTQEWPLGGPRHQLSYTIPLEGRRASTSESYDFGRGTIALNYRYQLATESADAPAISPRLSLLIPDFPASDAQFGLQLNLPASKQLYDFYIHFNAGYTVDGIGSTAGSSGRASAAGSLIYRAWPMVHVMAESVFRTREHDGANSLLLSPGVRAGFNLGDQQLVLGLAVPLGILGHDEPSSMLAYFSYELPFLKQ